MKVRRCLVLVSLIQGCSPKHPSPISPAEQHGFALAYIEGRLSGAFRLETTITMPPRPENKGWTANYIMIAGKRTNVNDQPMYQVGLVRLATSPNILRTFWAIEPHGKQLDYQEIAVVPYAPHRMALAAANGMLTIETDNHVVRSFKWKEIFTPGDHLYVQMGAEAIEPGDTVSGTFREISLVEGTAKPRRILPTCRYNDRGLALRRDEPAKQLKAGGTYTPGMPSIFVDCH